MMLPFHKPVTFAISCGLARGSLPLGWAVDAELALRFPVIFDYIRSTSTDNDFFISGDSGV